MILISNIFEDFESLKNFLFSYFCLFICLSVIVNYNCIVTELHLFIEMKWKSKNFTSAILIMTLDNDILSHGFKPWFSIGFSCLIFLWRLKINRFLEGSFGILIETKQINKKTKRRWRTEGNRILQWCKDQRSTGVLDLKVVLLQHQQAIYDLIGDQWK